MERSSIEWEGKTMQQLEMEWNHILSPPNDNDHCTLNNSGLIDIGSKFPSLCRYCNIIPYDRTLVKVDNGTKFLNASMIPLIENEAERKMNIIISQAPILSEEVDTRNRMWRCIFQNNVNIIVALAKVEDGFTGCSPYYPVDLTNSTIEWTTMEEQISVTLLKKPIQLAEGLELRIIEIKVPEEEQPKIVHHYLYNKWPNYGIPKSTKEIRVLAKLVLEEENNGKLLSPILIHCSGGVGRSGVFATILAAISMGKNNVKKMSSSHNNNSNNDNQIDFSLVPIIQKLRNYRHPWCVETFPQLQYTYLTILDAWKDMSQKNNNSTVSNTKSNNAAASKISSFFQRRRKNNNNNVKTKNKAENYLAPFNPTDKTAIQEVVSLANFTSSDVLYDLGCGDGRVLIEAVRSSELKSAIGVEYDKSYADRAMKAVADGGLNDKIKIIHGDACKVDMSDATVLFVYLVPEGLMKIRPKLLEMLNKGGCRILSNIFSIPDVQPAHVFEYTKAKLKLYLYESVSSS